MAGLSYRTADEVRLGDVIRVWGWLRSWSGVVCYIPGLSPPHPDLEYEDVRQWAYRTADGAVYPAGYYPEWTPVVRWAELVRRGPAVGLDPSVRLE